MAAPWLEIGDGVFVRRYAFYDQNIVAVLDRDEALVVDTRSSHRQAAEIQADLRAIGAPRVTSIVNTHGHYDHCFGNRPFRPAVIWGHERCVTMIRDTGERRRALLKVEMPELADELGEVVLDPPDRTFVDRATVEVGSRIVNLAYLGRGHTDNDIVLHVPHADVLCAGDLLENGATPYFGDGFPMDWPATMEAMLELTGPTTVVVPGHGDHAGRAFVERSLEELREVAARATLVWHGFLEREAAVRDGPYPQDRMEEPLDRALAQLRGDLAG